jgi:hypothetical protein
MKFKNTIVLLKSKNITVCVLFTLTKVITFFKSQNKISILLKKL